MTEPLYRLTWRDAAGRLCHGDPMPERDATAWADNARRNTPAIDYWLEPVRDERRTAA